MLTLSTFNYFSFLKAAFCTLESVKAVGECYMPVSGTVQEVNTPLTETPNIINKSPFDQGILKITG